MKWPVLLFLALPFSGYSQLVQVREIKRRPLARYFNTKESTIIYPVFVTKSRRVDSAINAGVRSILEADRAGLSLSHAIGATIRDGLTGLSYTITYKNRNFLSVDFLIEWSGAYISTSRIYLNFDLRTGAALTVDDVFEAGQLEKVKSLVFEAKRKFLNAYKAERLASMRAAELDSDTYQWLIGAIDDNCIDTVSVNVFALSKSGIEFIDECYFPHVIRAYQPDYSLKYAYAELAGYLKPEFRKRLTGPAANRRVNFLYPAGPACCFCP
jgi:hypothetical protein